MMPNRLLERQVFSLRATDFNPAVIFNPGVGGAVRLAGCRCEMIEKRKL